MQIIKESKIILENDRDRDRKSFLFGDRDRESVFCHDRDRDRKSFLKWFSHSLPPGLFTEWRVLQADSVQVALWVISFGSLWCVLI